MSTVGEFAAVVERVMCSEGWVCNPPDHEDIPNPGECLVCDRIRHRLGYRVYEALLTADWRLAPAPEPARDQTVGGA